MSPRRTRSAVSLYLEETREISWSLAMVVPLLLAYEVTMLLIQAPLRNGAEMVVSEALQQLPPSSLDLMRRVLLAGLALATLIWVRRAPPSVARAHWMLLEALCLALVLGPLVGWMVGHIGLSASVPLSAAPPPPWLHFMLSIGAGLWEEIVFRLLLLGGLAYVLTRLTPFTGQGALAISIVVSSLVFAFYHHVGDMGEAFVPARFAFRCAAGTILGILFAFRGLAVVVYMHVFYDVLCDLRAWVS